MSILESLKRTNNVIFNGEVAKRLILTCVLTMLTMFAMSNVALAVDSPETALGEDSAYKLIEVDKSGPNVITKNKYNESTGEIEIKYYKVDLPQSEYGDESNYSKVFYYAWGNNMNLNKVSNINSADIIYYINNTSSRISNNTYGADIKKNFVQLSIGNYGSAIENYASKISNIEGIFIDNKITGSDNFSYGGAIANYSKSSTFSNIEKISGTFIGNYAKGNRNINGGAIANFAESIYTTVSIGNISGLFIGNYCSSQISVGGAIAAGLYNINVNATDDRSRIEVISADFINNYSLATSIARGGAIYNVYAYIGTIIGDFVGNYANGSSEARGGAINNWGKTKNITGNFNSNYVVSGKNAYGGAVSNMIDGTRGAGIIEYICANFTGNYAQNTSSSGGAYGGALQNGGNITKGIVNSNFYNNYAIAKNNNACGGAIYTEKSIDIIADNGYSVFAGNYVQKGSSAKDYQAIWAGSSSLTLTLNSKNNGIITFYDKIDGLSGYGLHLTGSGKANNSINFVNGFDTVNKDVTTHTDTLAYFNNAKVSVDNVTVNLDYADNKITNYTPYSINITNSNADVNLALDINATAKTADTITTIGVSSGTITINSINWIGDVQRTSTDWQVKVLYLPSGSTLKLVLADSIQNEECLIGVENAKTEHRTETEDVPTDVNYRAKYYTREYDDIYAEKAIYGKLAVVTSEGGTQDDSLAVVQTRTTGDVDFVMTREEVIGDTLSLIANKETSEAKTFDFTGATYDDNNYTVNEDYEIGTVNGRLTIEGVTATKDITDDEGNVLVSYTNQSVIDLNGKKGFDLAENSTLTVNNTTLQGNDTLITANNDGSTVNLNNAILKGNIVSENGYTLNLDGETTLNGTVGNADAYLKETGTLNLPSNNHFENANLTIEGGTLNLINDEAQTFLAKKVVVSNSFNLNVDADLGAKTPSMDRLPDNTEIQNNAKINVKNINLKSDSKQPVTKIQFAGETFKDSVNYETKELSKATQTTTTYAPLFKYVASYDPETGMFTFVRGNGSSSNDFNPQVLSAPVANQTGGYSNVLESLSASFRHSDNFMSLPEADRIAQMKRNQIATVDVNNGVFSPLFESNEDAGYWFKPYATFENIPLKNGPKVQNIAYGTLAGFDTELKQIKHGFSRVFTTYIGYNGSSQYYSGVHSYQNGGLLGFTTTLYKGNFFNATTVTAGASVGENQAIFGTDYYTTLCAGIANKTGYNIEFKQGRFIIQPALMISYTFVNTFDYTNSAGVRIDSDPMHAIQINPGIKFIMNTKNDWQPYIAVSMVWNIMDETDVKANGIKLPSMSIDPYVQYGVGIQKRFHDRFMAFGQAMIQNGGRNGISLTFGLRWAIGRGK